MSGTKKVPYSDTTSAGVFLETGPAPTGGAVYSISVKSGESPIVTFPSTITIASGIQSETFDLTWVGPGTTVLQAVLTEYGGSPTTSGTIFELPVECVGSNPRLKLIAPTEASILVEESTTFAVVFSSELLIDDTVSLSVSDSSVVTFINGSTVSLSSGSLTGSFDVYSNKLGTVTITATHSSGTVIATCEVVAKHYGPQTLITGPTPTAANKLGPSPVT